ncbi:MAG: 6-phosphofructokinase [Planctomycetota bacterium]
MKKVGILTGGGDCPGLNAVIRGVTRKLNSAGVDVIGLMEGWRGMLTGDSIPLDWSNTDDIVGEGGTILGSSRTNPYKNEVRDIPQLKKIWGELELDALVAIGGDDTLGVATKLYHKENLRVVGCPKTIDNDLSSTDYTFGFDTSINAAMECIDRLVTTTRSHRRVCVVECMGRHAGWITAYAGMASGADVVLVPEKPFDLDVVCEILKKNRDRGKLYNLVVVSEGATFSKNDFVTQDAQVDDFGHVKLGGVGKALAGMIAKRTGWEVREQVLGHLQRGGAPTAADRVLGTRFGLKAASLVLDGDFGKMVALRGSSIVAVPLKEATGTLKILTQDVLEDLDAFMG